MKKFFYGLIALIIVLLIACYTILFTNFGNNIITNYVQNKVKQSIGMDLNITKFELRFSTLRLKANFANMVNVNVEGNLSLFKLGFDLDYFIVLDEDYAKNLGLNLKQKLEFLGKIQGKANDFTLDGKGYLFGSNVNLNSRIYGYTPIALTLNAPNLQIEQILQLVNLNDYAKGTLSASAQIKTNDLKPDGNAIIKLDNTYINYDKIQKDFGLTLPKNSELHSQILASIKENEILASSKTNNDYLTFQTEKTLYNLTNQSLNTDFKLQIPSLAKLENLTKTKLNGSLGIDGNASFVANVLNSLNANVSGLGGEVKASLQNNELIASLNNVSLEKLLALGGYGSLINGNLNASLEGKGIDFKNFKAQADIKNANLNPSEIKKIIGLDFPNSILNLQAEVNARNGLLDYNAVLTSNLLNIQKLQGTYDLSNAELKVNANANITDLSVFTNTAKQKLQGSLNLTSKAHLIGSALQSLDINANLADGTIKAYSEGKSLDVDVSKLDLEKLFVIVGMPSYANGLLNAKAHLNNLDFTKLNGNADINAKGLLNGANLSKMLDKKFPNDANYDLKTKIVIENNIANFDGSLNSNLADLSSFKGSFDLSKIILNSDFVLNLNDFSKLGFLLDRKLSGNAQFSGKINFDKNLQANISSPKLFEGKLDASLKNNVIDITMQNLNLSSLAKGMDFMDIYNANANLNATYNLLSQKGEVNLDMKDGKLVKNIITNTISALTKKDITTEVFHTANAKVTINKNLINFNANMQADKSKVKITSGSLNSDTGALKAPFSLSIDKASITGSIEGTSSDPKVKINAKSVLNTIKNIAGDKPKKEIDKQLNKMLNKIF